jgi:SAM-dependent methyltransferase
MSQNEGGRNHHSQIPEARLRRQVGWMKEQWTWLLQSRILSKQIGSRRLSALEVGCGPGLVMESLRPLFELEGIDLDEAAVKACRQRGLKASVGDAHRLPYPDKSFDIVLCSFLLLWVERPEQVLTEMSRVSRKWVVCLAEPDFGGRVVFPAEVARLDDAIIEGLHRRGADPMMGRKLLGLMRQAGLRAEVGVHPGSWTGERLKAEANDEWETIAADSGLVVDDETLLRAKAAYMRALEDGSLCLFNPIFYAIGSK